MSCLNTKLADRAKRILCRLFRLSDQNAENLPGARDFHLGRAIKSAKRP